MNTYIDFREEGVHGGGGLRGGGGGERERERDLPRSNPLEELN